jgi:hypothetical protein
MAECERLGDAGVVEDRAERIRRRLSFWLQQALIAAGEGTES